MGRRVGLPLEFREDYPDLVNDRGLVMSGDVEWRKRSKWLVGCGLHYFTDDWRQEFCWRRPGEGLLLAQMAGVVTGPDFSIFLNDPVGWRDYQAFRMSVICRYWSFFGVQVMPVVCFRVRVLGISSGVVWSVRGPGRLVGDARWLSFFRDWYDLHEPGGLVIFGRVPAVFARYLDGLGLCWCRRNL